MPNLLYLVHRVPHPPNRGDRIRSYHILKHLAQHANIYLATLADEPVSAETRAELNRLCTAVEIAEVGTARWASAAWSLARGRSATEGLFASRRLANKVANWARSIHFDSILAFCSSMAPYARIPALREVPTVVDLVDVDSEKFFEYAAAGRGLKSWLHRLEGHRLRKLERSLPSWVQAVTLVSESEADIYRGFCANDRTHAITNGVDLDYFQPSGVKGRVERCVFVGALDYRPNIQGICKFSHEVWPSVRADYPQATLALVGRNPDPAVRRLANLPGVEVIGTVPDVRPHLVEATLAVVPLQIARGVQNKVLEALAMARPVIASPGAAEGLGVTHGNELLIARTSAEWTQSIGDLFTDSSRGHQLGAAGRRFVEQCHRWEHKLERFGTLLGLGRCVSSVGRTATGA